MHHDGAFYINHIPNAFQAGSEDITEHKNNSYYSISLGVDSVVLQPSQTRHCGVCDNSPGTVHAMYQKWLGTGVHW